MATTHVPLHHFRPMAEVKIGTSASCSENALNFSSGANELFSGGMYVKQFRAEANRPKGLG